jgi:hypothetical protein
MERILRYVAAGLVLAGGLVHLKLWDDGYKDYPDENLGRSFLGNVIASVIVAVALVVWRHWAVVVAGLVVVNGTLLAFALSRTDRGIFGFTERGWEPSPEAALALVFEVAAGAILVWLLWSILTEGRSSESYAR